MKLTGHACTEATSGAEKAERRERAEGRAGGVRVEQRVRPDGIIITIMGHSLFLGFVDCHHVRAEPHDQ